VHCPDSSPPHGRAWIALLLLTSPLGCFKADDFNEEIGETAGDSTSSSDSTAGDDPSSSDADETNPDTSSSTDTDPSTTDTAETDPSDTTTGEPAACGDGNVDPGELCLNDMPTQVTLPFTALRLDYGRFGLHPGLVIVGGANAPAQAIVLPGDGDLTFGVPTTVPIDGYALSVDVADMDGDGDHDFITKGAVLSSRMNDGMGGFESPDVLDPGALGSESTRVVLGQFDGNMPLDAAWGDGYNTDWVRGNGFQGWTFGTAGSGQFTGGDSWVEVTEWGFDGDGFTDLAVTSQWESRVSIVRGMGNATFTEHGSVEICEPGTCEIKELHVDDLDADGNPDLVTSFEDGISVVMGLGDGTFGPFELYAVPGADHTTSGDIDNDGDVDLLVASTTNGKLHLFLGDGSGGFADPIPFSTPATSLRVAAMVDLDEDGAKELVTAYNYDGAGRVGVFEAHP
jgi:hypothetical protein